MLRTQPIVWEPGEPQTARARPYSLTSEQSHLSLSKNVDLKKKAIGLASDNWSGSFCQERVTDDFASLLRGS
jgi:hypothetical protein